MSDRDDDPGTDMDDTLRKMERERDHLEADIEEAREELRDMPNQTGLRDEAGDWRAADATGENETDEKE